MTEYSYGNLENAESYLKEALKYGEDCTPEEFKRVINLIEAAKNELKELKYQMEIPNDERIL